MYLSKNQWVGLDIARFICIFSIVALHGAVWAVSHAERFTPGAHIADKLFVFFGFFAYFTPLTAGATLQIHLSPTPRVQSMRSTALMMLIAGYGMNFLMFGPDHVLHWEALHFLSLAFLVLSFFEGIPGKNIIRIAIIPLSWIIAEWGRSTSFLSESYLRAMLLGDTARGTYWPLFPWISLVVLGMLLASLHERYSKRTFIVCAFTLGILLVGFGFSIEPVLLQAHKIRVWDTRPFCVPMGVVSAVAGASSIFLALCTAFESGVLPESAFSRNGIIYAFSRGFFWIYVLHMAMAYRLVTGLSELAPLELRLILVPLFLLSLSWLLGLGVVQLSSKKIRIRLVRA